MVYNDWGLYRFVRMLEYKCLLYGKELFIIEERDTTKTCHRSGQKQVMLLWQRTHRCGNYGLVMGRDDNNAINIYQRFLVGLRPHTGAGLSCSVLHMHAAIDDVSPGEHVEKGSQCKRAQ